MSLLHASIFSQLLSVVNRNEFCRLVKQTGAEKGAKGFSCWEQFVAMMFCQLAQAKSLREIGSGLRSCEGKPRHLGLREAPGHSTLAYANAPVLVGSWTRSSPRSGCVRRRSASTSRNFGITNGFTR